ncbi:MAG: heparinase II/III family protein [Rhodoferax sp.]|nr:heparinase II/III family protein [Rhodoferax sp.]
MILPYEDLSNDDRAKAVRAADGHLADGWARREYPTIRLDEPIPWDLEKPELRSWNFYIHSFDMVDSLLKAHSDTGSRHYLDAAVRIALEWAEHHRDAGAPGRSPMAWYDMAVGLRAFRMAYVLDAGIATGALGAAQQALLWDCLERHREHLADEANIVYQNNHGFYQAAGQIAMGRRFAARSPAMADALVQGRERMLRMVRQQFDAEGLHREHSPDYHRMVYETLKAMVESALVDDPAVVELTDRIEQALSWFVLPDQHIANFGDSDYRLMSRKPAEAQRKWRTPQMRWVVSGGQLGEPPDTDHRVFADGGYYIVRRVADDPERAFSHASYLAQIAGFHSRTHKHADDLSFIWSDRGVNLLIDAGRYGYLGKAQAGTELWNDGYWYDDPKRVYVEATRAHNTLEIDGRNAERKGVKPWGSAIRRHLALDNGLRVVETEVHRHRSMRLARVLVFNPGQWLLVYDWFHDNKSSRHEVRQWFHLAPQHGLQPDGDGFMVPLAGVDRPLRVLELTGTAVTSRPYLAEESPRLQGWWSAKERDLSPAYAFNFARSGVESGHFVTLFAFSQQALRQGPAAARAIVSGRNLQCSWVDDAGNHRLVLARPQDGPMTVEHTLTPGAAT